MGSIGPAEILVVLVIALIVLGPTRLPEAARSVGKAVSELRRMTTGFQSEVKDAFADKPPTYSTARKPGPAVTPAALPERPQDAEVAPADVAQADLEPLMPTVIETESPSAMEPSAPDATASPDRPLS